MKKKIKKIPIWVIIAIFVGIGLIVALTMFIVMMKVGEAESYRDAKEKTDTIVSSCGAVKAYLKAENEGEKLSDENKTLFENFEKAVDESSEIMKKLGDSRVVHNEDIREKYDTATDELGQLQFVAETEQLLMDALEDGALSDEELDLLEKSESELLQQMAKDYKTYRANAKAYNEKYADLKGKNKTELDADFAKLKQDGEELVKKYAKIDFEGVYGKSRDDILKFCGTIEEINKIISEKI
jgi:hypothetical protein